MRRELKDLLSELNTEQRKAVMHDKGRALCIAGPGSGKTKVITIRALRLANENGRNAVLTLAFNKAAAIEMQERAETTSKDVLNDESLIKSCKFATIHSYCYEIIRTYYKLMNKEAPKVLPEQETEKILAALYGKIAQTKFVGPETVKRIKRFLPSEGKTEEVNDPVLADVYEAFTEYKETRGLIDFDDMQSLALEILENNGRFAKTARERFSFVQVDEAQDMSQMQARIIQIIGGENVFFVADDDQSIYGFRGAAPELLKRLSIVGRVSKYMLGRNYRSGGEIIDVATAFIEKNSVRFRKHIMAEKTGGAVIVETFADSEAQAVWTAKKILAEKEKGNSVCVLYRNNASNVLPLLELCILALRDGKKIKPQVRGDVTELGGLGALKNVCDRMPEGVLPMRAFEDMRREGTLDVAMFTGETSGRRRFFKETVFDAIRILCKHTKNRADVMKLAIYSDSVTMSENGDPEVCFSTVHSAKGLEFDTVLVLDVVRGEFPFGGNETTSEEERRLMYVAMTRAKKKLYISYPRRVGNMTLTASTFIDEIMAL